MNLKQVLDTDKETILLVEIGAIIHDIGKLSKEFILAHSTEEKSKEWVYHTLQMEYDSIMADDEELKNLATELLDLLKDIKIPPLDISLYDTIIWHHGEEKYYKDGVLKEYGKPKTFEPQTVEKDSGNPITKIINYTDSFDSSEDRGNANDSQSICRTYKSSAFGHETEINIDILTEERKKVYRLIIDYLKEYSPGNVDNLLERRREFFDELKIYFSKTLGMTARGANDVLLWDHSYMSATFAKISVIDYLVTGNYPKSKADIEFKIFAVGWDYFGFINQSQKIPDIIGRVRILDEIKRQVRELLEKGYLVGNHVYEDDNGIYFVVPSHFDDNIENQIKNDIFRMFNEKLRGLVLPVFERSDDVNTITEISKIIDTLSKKNSHGQKDIFETPKWIEEWCDTGKKVCSICGKLPISNRDLCSFCEEIRKKGREKDEDDIQTKFIDEIAWNNSKKEYENVALISAHFDLDGWLSGDFIRSLFIKKFKMCDLLEPANQELGNLKRIIQRVLGSDIDSIGIDNDIKGKIENGLEEIVKCNFYLLNGNRVNKDVIINKILDSLVNEFNNASIKDKISKVNEIVDPIIAEYYIISESKIKNFIKNPSASRLYRVWNDTKRFFENIETDICQQTNLIEEAVIELQDDKTIKDLYGQKELSEGTLLLEIKVNGKTRKGEGTYKNKDDNKITVVTPHLNNFVGDKNDIYLIRNGEHNVKVVDKKQLKQYRTISLSPNLFQFLVPASNSLEILLLFKTRYEKEFDKVFGKLPLRIGVAYFKRNEPIFLILDSSIRFQNMFQTFKGKEEIFIVDSSKESSGKLQLELSETDSRIGININLSRGDGKIDWYHPYVMVDRCESKNKFSSPVGNQTHFNELKKGDRLKIIPNYFDFEFLDTSSKRFEIRVGENKKRAHHLLGKNGPRPYYLEEIEHIAELKKYLLETEDDFKKKNTITQLHNFRTLVASKIEGWGMEEDLIGKFVEDSIIHILRIRRTTIKDETKKENPKFEFVKRSVISGLFFDMMEIYHSITKTLEVEK